MADQFDELFDEKNVPVGNWFKFTNVGDKVGGIVTDIYDKKGDETFPDQKVFVLKNKAGEEYNVGIKADNIFLMQRTKKVRVGDMVGFEYTKEIPATVKGHHPAKSITPFIKYTEAGDAVRAGEGVLNS